jgi:NADH:ubiquinone oxidoreductase subunit 2 (subunit N)
MYLGDGTADARPLSLSPALRTALVFSVIGVIVIGIYPQPFINLAQTLMASLTNAASGTFALK